VTVLIGTYISLGYSGRDVTDAGIPVAVLAGVFDLFTEVVAIGPVVAPVGDVLRLVAVPVFGWAAWRDVRTRRVPNETWRPLVAIGVVLFAADAWNAAAAGGVTWSRFVLHAGMAVGFVVPLAYLFWRIGGFGGADVKAVMVLALLFPTYPTYLIGPPLSGVLPGSMPVLETRIGVFSFTILTNAVLAGAVYPVSVAVRNALAGRISWVMFVGRPIPVERIPDTYGRLLERPDGLTRRGLDLDALRMYLRWRKLTLAELRADPEQHRDPASLPAEPGDPTDGNVRTDGGTDYREFEDTWGAEAFLDDIEGSAYGTRPDELRGGVTVLTENDVVWVSPGLPFVVPLFLGLITALTVGDLFFGLLGGA
jgi:preflagellin peptidase FlaK